MGNKLWQWVGALLLTILAGTGVITINDLFSSLAELKGITYNYTGDLVSKEGIFTPEIWINTSYWEIKFGNYNGTKYENDGVLFKKRSYSRTLHVNMDLVSNIITTYKLSNNGTWERHEIPVQWNVPTYGKKWRLVKDGDSWSRSRTNKIQLVFNISDDYIYKWSFNLNSSEAVVDIDPLLTSYSKEEIVKESKIVELNSMTKCLYRTYDNPTKDNYCFDMKGTSALINGININVVTEIENKYYSNYSIEVCGPIELYSIINKSYYNGTVCHNETKIKEEIRWEQVNNLCWNTKESKEFRRCYAKQFNLDNYFYEDHVPFLGYDMKEYTIITSSGFNNTGIFNVSKMSIYWSFDDADLTGDVLTDLSGNGNDPTNNGATTGIGGIVNEAFGYATNDFTARTGFSTSNGEGCIGFQYNRSSIAAEESMYHLQQAGLGKFLALRIIDGTPDTLDFIIVAPNPTTLLRWSLTLPTSNDWKSTLVSVNSSGNSFWLNGSKQSLNYINGNAATTAWTDDVSGMTTAIIGARNNSGANPITFYNGGADEFFVTDQVCDQQMADNAYNDGKPNNLAKGIYGPYNTSGTFNQVNITSDCEGDSNFINWSQNSSSFEETTSATQINVGEQISGFFVKIDTTKCSWLDLKVGNLTALDIGTNVSAKHIDFEIPEFDIDSETYIEIGSFVINFTIDKNVTISGGGYLLTTSINGADVFFRLDINNVTKYDQKIRTLANSNAFGVWTFDGLENIMVEGQNNFSFFAREESGASGSVGFRSTHIHAEEIESNAGNDIEHSRKLEIVNIPSTSYTNIYNISIIKTKNHSTYIDLNSKVTSDTNNREITCFFNNTDTNEQSTTDVMRISSSGDINSDGIYYISSQKTLTTEIWKYWCKMSGSGIGTLNISTYLRAMGDTSNNTIYHAFTSISNSSITGSNAKILSLDNYLPSNSSNAVIHATINIGTNSGIQRGSSTPEFFINVTDSDCFYFTKRSIDSNTDKGKIKIYAECDNLTIGSPANITLFANVSSGEDIIVFNSTLLAYEMEDINVSQENTAPIPGAILVPSINQTVSFIIMYDWEDFTDPEGHSITYTTFLLNSDNSTNKTLCSNIIPSNCSHDTLSDNIIEGFFHLRVQGCDDFPTPACSNSTMSGTYIINNTGRVNLTILLDGLDIDRTYEFGTTANLTLITNSTVLYCLNISSSKYGNNYVCNNTNMTVLLLLDFLEHINLSDGTESHMFNFSASNDSFALFLWAYDDNDGDFSFAIHTTDDPVYNLTLTIAGVVSPVKEYYQGGFSILNFSSNDLYTEELFFSTAGVQTFGFDYSVVSILPNTSNCTFQIFGASANPESFGFYEGFLTNDSFESYDNDKHFTWLYENFSNIDTESNFVESETSSGNPSIYCTGALNDYEYSSGTYTVSKGAGCGRPKECLDDTVYDKRITSTTYFDNSDIDFQDYDYIKISYSYSLSSSCNTFQGSSYCTFANANARAFARLGIRDSNGGINYISDKDNSISCGANNHGSTNVDSATDTIILNKTENATQFNVYIDNVFFKTVTLSSSLTYGFFADASGFAQINRFGSSAGTGSNTIHSIEFGGIGLNLSGDDDFYKNITNFTSTVLNDFSENITSVYLRSTEFKPTGTTINYFINNISAVPDTSTILTSANNSLSLRIDIDKGSYTGTDMPHIIDYNIDVYQTAPTNVSIDIGGDNQFEINLTGELNSSTSPQNISFICSKLEDDISTYCDKSTESVCRNVPINIKIANSGTVNATSFNITFDASQNSINYRSILSFIVFNPTTIPIRFNATGGILNISNISIPYTGNGRITLKLYNFTTGIDEKNIDVRFTDFNRSFPSGISYYEPIASSINDKNVEPFGQTSSEPIYNITINDNLVPGSVFVRLNETSDSCFKIWINDIYSNNSGNNLIVLTNATVNVTSGDNAQQNIWSWANLTGCSPSVYHYFDFNFEWYSLCNGCVTTFDWNTT